MSIEDAHPVLKDFQIIYYQKVCHSKSWLSSRYERWKGGHIFWSFERFYGRGGFQFQANWLDSWLSRRQLYAEGRESGSLKYLLCSERFPKQNECR